jgi:hypothetical protein
MATKPHPAAGAVSTAKSARPLAFITLSFGASAVTACIVIFPLIFQYLQTLSSQSDVDLNFCRVSFGFDLKFHRIFR